MQKGGSELRGGSGWMHVGTVGERDRPDWNGGHERHTAKLWATGKNHAGDYCDPEPGLDEAEDRVHLAPLDGEPRLESRSLAGRQGHRSEVVALPEHHQRPVPKIIDSKRLKFEGHTGRHRDGELLTKDRDGVQNRIPALQR